MHDPGTDIFDGTATGYGYRPVRPLSAPYPLHPIIEEQRLDDELSQIGEIRAEAGMSYVCGGGLASDARAATYDPRLAEAERTLIWELAALRPWTQRYRAAEGLTGNGSLPDDDIPF